MSFDSQSRPAENQEEEWQPKDPLDVIRSQTFHTDEPETLDEQTLSQVQELVSSINEISKQQL